MYDYIQQPLSETRRCFILLCGKISNDGVQCGKLTDAIKNEHFVNMLTYFNDGVQCGKLTDAIKNEHFANMLTYLRI